MWKTLDGFLAEKLYENGIIRVLAGAGALGLSVSIKILWRWTSKKNFFRKIVIYSPFRDRSDPDFNKGNSSGLQALTRPKGLTVYFI